MTRDHNTYADMNGQVDQYVNDMLSEQMKNERAAYAAAYWVTKTGREVPIRQMEDEHLKNAHAMVARKTRRFPAETKEAAQWQKR